jgi:predicted nucleic acid-binding Zn ribbon protein
MADREKPQRGFQPLKGIIGEILDQYRLGGRPDPNRVWQIWERAVGPALARNASPAAVKKGLLLVHVNSSAWLQELHFQKAALIARINQEAGEVLVEDIRFKIGPLRPINIGNGR